MRPAPAIGAGAAEEERYLPMEGPPVLLDEASARAEGDEVSRLVPNQLREERAGWSSQPCGSTEGGEREREGEPEEKEKKKETHVVRSFALSSLLLSLSPLPSLSSCSRLNRFSNRFLYSSNGSPNTSTSRRTTGLRGRSVDGSVGTRSSLERMSWPPTRRPKTVCLPGCFEFGMGVERWAWAWAWATRWPRG